MDYSKAIRHCTPYRHFIPGNKYDILMQKFTPEYDKMMREYFQAGMLIDYPKPSQKDIERNYISPYETLCLQVGDSVYNHSKIGNPMEDAYIGKYDPYSVQAGGIMIGKKPYVKGYTMIITDRGNYWEKDRNDALVVTLDYVTKNLEKFIGKSRERLVLDINIPLNDVLELFKSLDSTYKWILLRSEVTDSYLNELFRYFHIPDMPYEESIPILQKRHVIRDY